MAAADIFKNPALQHKIMVTMEVLMPPLIHWLNLSIVEILIHGKMFYNVFSDSPSTLFVMSVAMIYQAFRKKLLPNATKTPAKMFLMIFINVFVCDMTLRLIYLPLQYVFYFSVINGHLASFCEKYLFFLKVFDRWLKFSKLTVALRDSRTYPKLKSFFSVVVFFSTLKTTKCFTFGDFKESIQLLTCPSKVSQKNSNFIAQNSSPTFSDSESD